MPCPPALCDGETMTGNAFGMVAGRVAAMGLGFVFWLLAAHAASQSDVGFAAAVIIRDDAVHPVRATGLGVGRHYAAADRIRPLAALLDVTLTMTAVGSAVVGAAFLVVAKAWLPELGQVATVPVWTAAFIALCVFGTLGVVLDQVNVGLQRGRPGDSSDRRVRHHYVGSGPRGLGGRRGDERVRARAVLGCGRRGCDLRRSAPVTRKCAAVTAAELVGRCGWSCAAAIGFGLVWNGV